MFKTKYNWKRKSKALIVDENDHNWSSRKTKTFSIVRKSIDTTAKHG